MRRQGFVILDDFVGHPLVDAMRAAARRVVADCNAGRVCCRGASAAEGSATAVVRGLYHPAFAAPEFAAFFCSPEFLTFTTAWTGLQPEELELGAAPFLFCGGTTAAQRTRTAEEWTAGGGGTWHRDTPDEFRRPLGTGSGRDSSGRAALFENAIPPPPEYSLAAERAVWRAWRDAGPVWCNVPAARRRGQPYPLEMGSRSHGQ
jgi:hypothetical protein